MSQIAAGPPPGASLAGGLATSGRLPPVRVWALALTAGLIAGFASWLIGETFHGRFEPPDGRTGVRLTPAQIKSLRTARDAAGSFETTIALGSLGAVLGLTLGLAGGCARGSARAALIAAIAGSILGGTAGAVMPRVLLPIYFRVHDPDRDDLMLAILIQGGNWCVIGAAAGAAFGIGLGGRGRALRALLGGLLGATAGVLVYEMVGALAFPLDGTSDPVSATWGTRLFARLAAAIFISAGAAIGALGPAKGAIEPRAFSSRSVSLTPDAQPRS
jgi:outer membrane lipoprotein SlyB